MKTSALSFFLILFLTTSSLIAQNATVKGVILDESNIPVSGVAISYDDQGTLSDFNGFYFIEIPANQDITITFSHISNKNVQITVNLDPNEDYEFNPVMKVNVEQIGTVIISGRENKKVEGIVSITPESIRRIPGANAGVENLLKSLPGVSGNNELSTQYAVRGGNYDEKEFIVGERFYGAVRSINEGKSGKVQLILEGRYYDFSFCT